MWDKKRWWITVCVLVLGFCLTGCAAKQTSPGEVTTSEIQTSKSVVSELTAGESVTEEEREPEKIPRVLSFYDAQSDAWYEAEVQENAPMQAYDWTKLSTGDIPSYEDGTYVSELGIDVSHHQGEIDWESVAAAGVKFAIIRIAYRGYGESGTLKEDRFGMENVRKAQAAGLAVGVYIYSQAISEEEAVEEAEFVIALLGDTSLELPIVFDEERVLGDVARTDGISAAQMTANARAFCDRIQRAGYEAMIYSNVYSEMFLYDMEALSDIPFWYADYEPQPQTPYAFEIWQCSESGKIPGIAGNVDVNLRFLREE
ncbi:MAG: glycoside hydrolase family 25 protein [Lachnospiraceae bacterium]|nr:glycoside hydrolase family 25 protein [Lachnospiraceae bacterium]